MALFQGLEAPTALLSLCPSLLLSWTPCTVVPAALPCSQSEHTCPAGLAGLPWVDPGAEPAPCTDGGGPLLEG